MTRRIAALAVLIAAGLAAVAASCSVHRQSDAFACEDDDDCRSSRVCVDGFCVTRASSQQCPAGCDDCDLDELTCRIVCDGSEPCAAVRCPPGYDCTIRCSTMGACGDIDCAGAHSCDIDCSGPSSCGAINCGAGECEIRCAGAQACPSIDCAASCACDVQCNNPSVACPKQSCPVVFGPCTEDGSAGAPCSSTELGCDRCI